MEDRFLPCRCCLLKKDKLKGLGYFLLLGLLIYCTLNYQHLFSIQEATVTVLLVTQYYVRFGGTKMKTNLRFTFFHDP